MDHSSEQSDKSPGFLQRWGFLSFLALMVVLMVVVYYVVKWMMQ